MKKYNTFILSVLAFAQGAIITYSKVYLNDGVSLEHYLEKTSVLTWLVFLGIVFMMLTNMGASIYKFFTKRIVKVEPTQKDQ